MIAHNGGEPSSRICLPKLMSLFHADATRSEPSGYGCWLIGEEDPVLGVLPTCQMAQSARTIETTINSVRPISPERSWRLAQINLSLSIEELVVLQSRLLSIDTIRPEIAHQMLPLCGGDTQQ